MLVEGAANEWVNKQLARKEIKTGLLLSRDNEIKTHLQEKQGQENPKNQGKLLHVQLMIAKGVIWLLLMWIQNVESKKQASSYKLFQIINMMRVK